MSPQDAREEQQLYGLYLEKEVAGGYAPMQFTKCN